MIMIMLMHADSQVLYFTTPTCLWKTISLWSWLYGSWIYNYLCNLCLSPLMLWVWTSWWDVLDTTLCDKVCQWLATGRWFSPGTPVSSINKTDRHDINEILLKVALNTINQTKPHIMAFNLMIHKFASILPNK